MASITTRPNGHRWILFTAPDKKRHTIRLGKASMAQAETFKHRVEVLIAAKLLDQPPDSATIEWLSKIDRSYYDKLATAGLCTKHDVRTVKELVLWHLAEMGKGSAKPSTIRNITRAGENLRAYFTDDRSIGTITFDDANNFRKWLQESGGQNGKPLAKTTVSRRCRRARQIFAAAAKPHRRWVAANPFEEMGHWCEVNQERNVYIEQAKIEFVLDELTDDHVRLVVALARYAGLRAPSEPLDLEWQNIDWATNTMNVHCIKTQQYEGKEWRTVPIFPELLPHLQKIYDRLPERATNRVFEDFHGKAWTSFSRRIEAACRRLGIPMWIKPFINMRASCEHDWLQKYPINVVAAWMGHSPQVALRHYSRVSKELTARAASNSLLPTALHKSEVKGEVPGPSGAHLDGGSRTTAH